MRQDIVALADVRIGRAPMGGPLVPLARWSSITLKSAGRGEV
jgi:hypothetical protein